MCLGSLLLARILLLAAIPALAEPRPQEAGADAVPTPEVAERAHALTLPASSAADALLRLVDVDGRAPASAPWPAWDDAAWETQAPWSRWSDLLLAELLSDAHDGRAARRAELARCAALQGRGVDAWEHFATAAQDAPEIAAALLPTLMPGVEATGRPADAPAPWMDGGALEDGVLLRPILPPLDQESPFGRPRIRGMTLRDLRIGSARCDMTIKVEADGVEVSFLHTGGGPATVRVVLPIPHDREVRSLYVDWARVDEIPEVVEMNLVPSVDGIESEAAAWARFLPRRLTWPAPGELIAPRQIQRAGLALIRADDDPIALRIDRLAVAIESALGLPCVSAVRPPRPPGRTAPLAIAFPSDEDDAVREARLAFLVSAVERYRLRR